MGGRLQPDPGAGEVDSTVRTPPQSEIGLFWTEHPGKQYARAFNYLVENYSLNAMESARLMAILWTGVADAAIGCWNAKFTYNFWRPVTAIPAGGGIRIWSQMRTGHRWGSRLTIRNIRRHTDVLREQRPA